MARNLLITGATGKQGGAVISALLSSGVAASFNIYAVTRNVSSPAATSLASKAGVTLVSGDLDDPSALFESVGAPVWGVFSVQTFMGAGHTVATEQRQGIKLIDAAIAHGHVQQFVYTSVDRGGPKSASDPTPVPHFMNKYHIEKHLERRAKETGMGYTILRPVCFMEMLAAGFPGKATCHPTITLSPSRLAAYLTVDVCICLAVYRASSVCTTMHRLYHRPHAFQISSSFVAGKGFTALWRVSLKGKPLQVISTADIGYFAAQAFANPSSPQYANTAVSLAGDSLTYDQAVNSFRQSTGKPMPTTYDFAAKAYLWADRDIGTMFKWFADSGYGADIPALRKLHPAMMTFGDWVQQKSAWRKT